MTTYARDEAAHRCGCDRAYLDRLIELGILVPDADDRLSIGDLRRAQMSRTLEGAGISPEDLAAGIGQGVLTLNFMDAPVFARFATFGDETFDQVSERTSLPLELLLQVRESTGGATPEPAIGCARASSRSSRSSRPSWISAFDRFRLADGCAWPATACGAWLRLSRTPGART